MTRPKSRKNSLTKQKGSPARKPEPTENQPNQIKLDSLAIEIERQVGDLLPQGSRNEIVARLVAVTKSETFSGPIAHPRHLKEYEDILPGSAERILAMAEKQQLHFASLETQQQKADNDDRRLGMWLGGGLFAALILCGLVATLTVGAGAGGIFLTVAAIGGVTAFVNGRKNGNGSE